MVAANHSGASGQRQSFRRADWVCRGNTFVSVFFKLNTRSYPPSKIRQETKMHTAKQCVRGFPWTRERNSVRLLYSGLSSNKWIGLSVNGQSCGPIRSWLTAWIAQLGDLFKSLFRCKVFSSVPAMDQKHGSGYTVVVRDFPSRLLSLRPLPQWLQ